HIKEYFPLKNKRIPIHLWAASAVSYGGLLTAGIISSLTRLSIEKMARKFIAGENIEELLSSIKLLEKEGMEFTIDVLGEETTSERQAEEYVQTYLKLIEEFSTSNFSKDSKEKKKINLSLKVSSLYSQFDPLAFEDSVEAVIGRIMPIIQKAEIYGGELTIDMENFHYRNLIVEIVKNLFQERISESIESFGTVVQAYLKDSQHQLEELLKWESKSNQKLHIRLVKGAYWDYEVINSQKNRWQCPVFTKKEETDANFEILSAKILQHNDKIKPAFATHNIRSIASALALAEYFHIPKTNFEFQLLYGMGNPIKKALVDMGFKVRVYTPFGKLIPGMGYLVRRILENTSNNSFLMKSFFFDEPVDTLLASPHKLVEKKEADNGKLQSSTKKFQIEPLADFSFPDIRKKMLDAIASIKKDLGKEYPLVIGGKKIKKISSLESVNPSNPDEIIGYVSRAERKDGRKAIEWALKSQKKWKSISAEKRCEFILKTAELMRKQRFKLAALEVLEGGKPMKEADADVCEAIDYLEYYASEMQRLDKKQILDPIPGEINEYSYIPRGIAVVISPWNFPLAILTGMTSAALVTGNAVIMKPAEQTSVIAYKFYELLEKSGIPEGIVNFLPGLGEEIGEYLVKHPKIDIVAFTGSKEVGLRINKLCANTKRNQKKVKKVIAEMGGKNALIIDNDADIDVAIKSAIESAFGYQGQKCSACSRLIVLDGIYNEFTGRLIESTKSLKIGPAESPSTFIGPLIDEDAYSKVKFYIEKGKSDAKLLYETPEDKLPDNGYFIGPVIFECMDNSSLIAKEEIFGPVLAVFRVKDIKSAIELANDCDFALTGGIISRSPANIEKVKNELEAGNIYINRRITGAVVGRQPFGGYKLSGMGSKAGGPDYLLQFMIPKTLCENIMRHGYAPLKNQ
ncbi:MAG: L-glutamate gamma-semialdehyde dehydrogenase, partial [Candidatus Schekmanbacteria bacterium]